MNAPTQESELFRISCHEWGHALCAIEFGLSCEPKAFSFVEQTQPISISSGERIAGICVFDGRATRWQKSCVGWGGICAELVAGCALGMPIPFEPQFIRQWYHIARHRDMSADDKFLIYGYPRPLRSFKAAARILSKQREQLISLSRTHANIVLPPPPKPPPPPPEPVDDPPLPTMPLPDKWPASNLYFVRLVIEPSGKPGVETFNRFAAGLMPGLSCVAALQAHVEESLKTRPGWERLARDFYRWQRDNPQPATPEAKEHDVP
jgi:hypothetical protein